jgi:cytochrome c oxidase subunit 2
MQDLLGSLPPNVSTYGADIDFLYRLILYITTVAFLLVQGTLIVFMWRYRAGARARATYTHGNTRLEMIWTTVPAVILVLLGILSRGTWNHIKRFMPPADVVIKVTGKQFNWEILYSGPDGKFGTADDYQVDNDLRVPVNKVVRVLLGSHDVIHSFFVPQARLKQDALPGREIPAWFEITKPGEYEIPCAELCGFGHSGMKGSLKVLSDSDYAAWLKEQWPPAGTPTPESAPPTASSPAPAAKDPAGRTARTVFPPTSRRASNNG